MQMKWCVLLGVKLPYAPLAGAEGVGHADDVVPFRVPEIFRQQRSDGPPRSVAALAGEERVVELPQLLASLQDQLVGREVHGVRDLPRLYLAVVEAVLPSQNSTKQSDEIICTNWIFYSPIKCVCARARARTTVHACAHNRLFVISHVSIK